MDRPLTTARKRGNRLRSYAKWGGLLLAFAAAVLLVRYLLRPTAAADRMRVETVERGTVANTVTATGLVVAAFEEQINAPVTTQIRRVFLTAGAEVAAGEVILELDREFVQLELEGKRDQLALRKNKVSLLALEYDRDLRELTFDTDIKSLELEAAEAELADARRLLEIGGTTQEDVERAALQVNINRLQRDKLKNERDYRRASLDDRRRNLELEVNMEEKEVSRLARKLRETELRAPRAGVVTWVNESIGQSVTEGTPLARVADLGRYRLEGSCSDRYADRVSVGLPVEVRLPEHRLRGTIVSVLPEVKDNTLKFLVELDEPSHEALRPNLRTELTVEVGRSENVLRVKNGPVFRGGVSQPLFVMDAGGRAVRTQVGLGMRNGEYIEITSGVRAGDRVIVSDTQDFEHLSSFTLEKKN